MGAKLDLVGLPFGRLVAKAIVGKTSQGKMIWECECACGTLTRVVVDKLKSGHTRSCGCLQRETVTKHGQWSNPLWAVHQAMMQRCYNPNHPSYHNYGGRGIRVCERWHQVENFLADVGERPLGMELEREDNDGDYTPTNWKWASHTENNRNKRTNHTVTLNGESHCLAEWAELLDMRVETLYDRKRRGYSDREILTYPRYQRR